MRNKKSTKIIQAKIMIHQNNVLKIQMVYVIQRKVHNLKCAFNLIFLKSSVGLGKFNYV